MFDGVDAPRYRWLRGAEDFCQELFGEVMAMIEQRGFESLGQGERWGSTAWGTPGEVVAEVC